MLTTPIVPTSYLKVFPKPEEVFASPVARYTRHFLPLVSIDLSVINSEWIGWIHMINPCEPADGVIGELTQDYHSYYCRSNWIGFHLNENNQYEWLGDWRYFVLENNVEGFPSSISKDTVASIMEEMEEQYSLQHKVYNEAKALYKKHQLLYSPSCFDPNEDYNEPNTLIEDLGVAQGWANWCNTSNMPLDETTDEENIVPITPDGKRFHFIARVAAYNYCENGADDILIFYEPESRTVLFTFDWT